ncbi:hypothetical protein G6N82_02825 [Altererythrobacter sp. BO-6]|uniref:hypothetical protein n=1 Tax=Altererythrobacter sp. BO-6 TaxID=2604537 RepID=UPI0013E11C7B|nr:hypothetical protein [Altererythrobacter sp. BO-6]QIG53228.1 hypothetical protein G6N82_02825 [Altererythrobacter sp. BO-6]
MFKRFVIAIVLLAGACDQTRPVEAEQRANQPKLFVAANSVSLEFPLQFGAQEDPSGYIKVSSKGGREESPEKLISALVLCSPEVAWIEKTSHSIAFIMPSDENVIRAKDDRSQPTDDDIVACIKDSAQQTFFYRKLPKGTVVYRR